jgi:hypothetical protein
MPIYSYLQSLFIARSAILIHIQHVRQKEGRTFLLYRIGQITERLGNIGSIHRRFELNNLSDYMQQMASSFLRRNEFLHLIAKEKRTDLIIIDTGRKRQDCSNLSQNILSARSRCTEKT